MIYAHVAGLPVEETLPTLAPAACALAVLIGARLRTLAASLRRRQDGKQTR